jgi:hypothetical protein
MLTLRVAEAALRSTQPRTRWSRRTSAVGGTAEITLSRVADPVAAACRLGCETGLSECAGVPREQTPERPGVGGRAESQAASVRSRQAGQPGIGAGSADEVDRVHAPVTIEIAALTGVAGPVPL